MPIPLDTYLKIKRIQTSKTTGYGNLEGCGGVGRRIKIPSCSWSIVWWNTAFEKAGILQNFGEMIFTNIEIEGQMIIIRRFREGYFNSFILYFVWTNKIWVNLLACKSY